MKNFKEISARLEIAKKKIEKNITKDKSSNAASLGKALKISTELVASVVVGTLLGFILDGWFDTRPWLTISFFFMGVGAGFLNVIRSAKNMHKKKDMENN
jgi:ATP synthase protein I|tara:strand:+ start:660 stop:959 length:300 start_codon:yes stop_codon:yes gene_type:complete